MDPFDLVCLGVSALFTYRTLLCPSQDSNHLLLKEYPPEVLAVQLMTWTCLPMSSQCPAHVWPVTESGQV